MTVRDEIAIHNERVKLRANTANAIALGLIGFGLLRPLTDNPSGLDWSAALWLIAGLAIHAMAGYILKGMRRSAPQ